MKALLLAAGLGTRLGEITSELPKCLMPIGDAPLLSYWIDAISKISCDQIIVNTHYKADLVSKYIEQLKHESLIKISYEKDLLGTAGTIRNNFDILKNEPTLVIHADNWCPCDLQHFVNHHSQSIYKKCLITMMTFNCDNPKLCGIVELDEDNIVQAIYEKQDGMKSNLANGAVYIIEPKVTSWIKANTSISDFSTEVLPHFMGKISAWHNAGVLRDIGSPKSLIMAQYDQKPNVPHNVPSWLSALHNDVKQKLKKIPC